MSERPIIDERETIPQEEMETLYISAMRLLNPLSEQEYAEIGKGIVAWVKQQDGYPKRVYARIVSS